MTRRLFLAAGGMFLLEVPALFVDGLWPLAVVMFIAGSATAPLLITSLSLAQRLVPKALVTEGMAVAITGILIGISLGSAIAELGHRGVGRAGGVCRADRRGCVRLRDHRRSLPAPRARRARRRRLPPLTPALASTSCDFGADFWAESRPGSHASRTKSGRGSGVRVGCGRSGVRVGGGGRMPVSSPRRRRRPPGRACAGSTGG